MKHPAKIQNGQLLMQDREAFKSEISNKRDGNYYVELKRETRSNPQNRYYWGVVIDTLSKELGYEPEEMHEILKYKFNKGVSPSNLPMITVLGTFTKSFP